MSADPSFPVILPGVLQLWASSCIQGGAVAEWLEHWYKRSRVQDSLGFFLNSLLPAGNGDNAKEEEWHPTLVTLLLVQVGFLTAPSRCDHWLTDNLYFFYYIPTQSFQSQISQWFSVSGHCKFDISFDTALAELQGSGCFIVIMLGNACIKKVNK